MAECEQFSKWRLVRVSQCNSEMDFGAMQRLKIGPNSIGRNMRADIITESVYASRMHCVLFVTKNNDIILTDVVNESTILVQFSIGHNIYAFYFSVIQWNFCQWPSRQTNVARTESE